MANGDNNGENHNLQGKRKKNRISSPSKRKGTMQDVKEEHKEIVH